MCSILIANKPGALTDFLVEQLHGSYSVQVCHSGAEATKLLDRLHPDILILHLSLPDIDGLSALHNAHHRPKATVLLTTLITNSIIEQAGDEGVNDIISLPYSAHSLIDLLLNRCSLIKNAPSQDL